MNLKKIVTIFALPIMWLIYYIFELLTGRITDSSTTILCIAIFFLAIIPGIIFNSLQKKYNYISLKKVSYSVIILIFIEQIIKVIIKFFFFNTKYDLIPNILSFNPIINTNGSWINARFNTGISFNFLIFLNAIAIFIFIELYRYYRHKNFKNLGADLCIIFILSGSICSLIDKVFYGGSLDYIGISNLFIADLKDIYINIGVFLFFITLFNSNYFNNDTETSLKDDLKEIYNFILFIKDDLLKRININ